MIINRLTRRYFFGLQYSLRYFGCRSGSIKQVEPKFQLHKSSTICLDYDGLENVAETKAKFSNDQFVLLCFISPRGNGLKVFVEIETENNKVAWLHLNQYFYEKTGLNADKSGKDVCRACFDSYDSEAFLNVKNLAFQLKIGQNQYRNEDLGAIYAKNRETAVNQKLEKSLETHQTQKESKQLKKILTQNILSEYQSKSEDINNSQSKLVDFGNGIEPEKKAFVKKNRVKGYEIKVEKIGRGRGIRR